MASIKFLLFVYPRFVWYIYIYIYILYIYTGNVEKQTDIFLLQRNPDILDYVTPQSRETDSYGKGHVRLIFAHSMELWIFPWQSFSPFKYSVLQGYNSRHEYIVTQGCVPSTLNDFWRMVWEHRCRFIVMMTRRSRQTRLRVCNGDVDDSVMGLLPDAQNSGLRMRRECRDPFPRHRLQRKPLVSDPGMHHGTCPCRDACRDRKIAVARKTFPAFLAHAQLVILRIW